MAICSCTTSSYKTVNPLKLEPRAHGPYTITQVYTNGTVDVRLRPNIIERINIRRLIPYRRHV